MRRPDPTRARRVHQALTAYIAQHGYAPSMDDLRELAQVGSKNTVSYTLAALERDGLIRRDACVPRGIALLVPWQEGDDDA